MLFAAFGLYMIEREKKIIQDIYQTNTLQAASIVATNLAAMMSEGDSHSFAESIRALNIPGHMQVGIVASDGRPAFSTSLPVPPGNVIPEGETSFRDGDDIVLFLPLANKAACHRCHNPNDRIRGTIIIRNRMTGLKDATVHTATRLLVASLVLGVLVTGAVMWLINRKVVSPLKRLMEGARAFSDGDLKKRVLIPSQDEFGAVAETFNKMAENLASSHDTMEKSVHEKTTELRVIAELSHEVFRGELALDAVIRHFVSAMVERMACDFASIFLLERSSGRLVRKHQQGIALEFPADELFLWSDHRLAAVTWESKPVMADASELGIPIPGMRLAVVPVLSHQRKRCSEVNLCLYDNCPAYSSADSRCWLIQGTYCRSPQAVSGAEKISGCLQCPVLPCLGVLVAGKTSEFSESSLHSIEILASTIASAIENQMLLEKNRDDILKLVRLHNISLDTLQQFDETLPQAIVSHAISFSHTDAGILWLLEDGSKLVPWHMEQINERLIPDTLSLNSSFPGQAILENRPIEALEINDFSCLKDVINFHDFRHMIALPLRFKQEISGCLVLFRKRDFLLSDSEKAITLLFASQAAAAISSIRAYNELKGERDFSEAIFNSASSGIIVTDSRGSILKINALASATLHLDSGKAAGIRLQALIPGTEAMLTITDNDSQEISLQLDDNTAVPIGFRTSLFIDPVTAEEVLIIIFKNLSETKKLQERLRQKEHFEVLGKVIAGVAHEIRNPLFGISSIGQILRQELDDAKHTILVEALLKECGRMNRLIEELLLCTRPSTLHLQEIDLFALLQEILPAVRARRPEIVVRADFDAGTRIRADRDKMVQLFLNLLNNAADAAQGDVAVSVTKEDPLWLIAIHNDGPSIRPEHLSRIFEPFFTTKKHGTGLGLPICKKIIEDHGGSIDLASREGEGTTVTVALPA